MKGNSEYEVVVGLEVHVQLLTKSKLFSGDSIAFGAEPNTQVSPVTLAHPGTLPVMNKAAVEMAVKMGLACECTINRRNFFARKNYFYPDLPKGYQVSQHTAPICLGGKISITTGTGKKDVRLNRIHLEEDAGKSLHDVGENYTSVDFNRAGTPLIEIVTEPDLRSADEAFAFVSEIRKLVRYLGISDGNMEEGSLRCDANISVRPEGEAALGTRVEVKNLNSIRNVKRAIEYEAGRLISLMEKNEPIVQETRSFEAGSGTTFPIRGKEEAEDYRYFADPDISPFHLEEEFIASVKNEIPLLPAQRINIYMERFGLSAYDAAVLTEERPIADYFESLIAMLEKPGVEELNRRAKQIANWILGPVKTWLNEQNEGIDSFPISRKSLLDLIDLVAQGKVSFTVASTRVFDTMLKEPDVEPFVVIERENLYQQSDTSFLEPIVEEVLQKHSDKVKEYQKGKKGLISLFIGEVMKRSGGKADPKLTSEMLMKKLKK